MDNTKDLQELKQQLSALHEDFTGLKKSVADLSAKKVKDAKNGIGDEVSSVLELVEDKIAQYKEQSASLVDSINDDLKQKPLVGIAIAFGAGVLLTKLFGSSK